MVTAEELTARREEIAAAPDLAALLAHLTERAAPLLARLPPIPETKALLSTDGGICPEDGAAFVFDPWNPTAHRCPRCEKTFTGERHDRHWARYQHLWLAERAAHLATLAALADNAAAADRAVEILRAYTRTYWGYANQDNVLGPSRLFFSTYLESIWIGNFLAAAALLRACGRLEKVAAGAVSGVAEEAANLIGEFDEGFSNRQTWNNAALAAIAGWFEDEDLAKRAIEGPTGLLEHLLRGFGRDGMWYEGENYHLFALQMLEMRDAGSGMRELSSWLAALYQRPAPAPELFESYLHDAPVASRISHPASRIPHPASRITLSWWSLLEMAPELPGDAPPWSPGSQLLESQGLAVLRTAGGARYASLECGPYGGGHGHPDRLHLTLHADGVHWLADPGTGSYVSRDLFWYRSTLAHNAPRLDGASQSPGGAVCEAFDTVGEWTWVRGRYEEIARTLVSGPGYLLDVVDLASRTEHVLELPWHFRGAGDVGRGTWTAGELADDFVSRVEQFVPDGAPPVALELAAGARTLRAFLSFEGQLVRAEGPGRPGEGKRETFYVVRAAGRSARFVTVLEPVGAAASVRGVRGQVSVIEVDTAGQGLHRHAATALGWEITTNVGRIRLAGARQPEPPFEPLLELDKPTPAVGAALRVAVPPPLDGSLDGFDTSEPLRLALEDQYRRSEEPYPGPDDFSAVAHAAWDDDALYLAVEVVKPELCFRPGGAPPLRLDNEPDDIHSDGLQVYLAGHEASEIGRAHV